MKNVDAYYAIGLQHRADGKPCQDHALAMSDIHGAAVISISDGCSSGGATDMGARIVNYATAQAIEQVMTWQQYRGTMMEMVDDIARQRLLAMDRVQRELHLSYDDLLATNLYVLSTDAYTYAHIVGDGVMAIVTSDGVSDVWRYVWSDNTPYYPAYDMGKQTQFIIAHGGGSSQKRLTQERWRIAPDGSVSQINVAMYDIMQGMRGIVIDLSQHMKICRLKNIALFSDGVELVDGLPWLEVVRQSMAYKNVKGAFVKRRMMRLIKDVTKNHKGPLDDIACATMDITRIVQGGE